MTFGSNLTLPLSVVSATLTDFTPAFFFKLDSIEWTHDAQVIPKIWKARNGGLKGF